MSSPWVIEELREHPHRLLGLQALGLLAFVFVFVLRMPSHNYTMLIYPSESPRVKTSETKKRVESKQVGVSKRVMGRLSEVPRGAAPDTLPRTPVPSASPVASPSGPREPSPSPSVRPPSPSGSTTPPVDLGPPSNEPDNSSEPIPSPTHPIERTSPVSTP